MNQFQSEMDEECRSAVEQEALPSTSAPSSMLITDVRSETELPEIMASLGLDENTALATMEDCSTSSSGNFKLRRSKRKQAVPRIAVGGVTKRRCILKMKELRDMCLHESDDEIKEFYENYNKNFKKRKSTCLETIYEEPKEKNGMVVLSGPKRKRSMPFQNFESKAKIKKRQDKIKYLQLGRGKKPERKRFSIEEVKEHLAQTGLVSLPAQ